MKKPTNLELDLNKAPSTTQMTPLARACWNKSVNIVRLLLESPLVDINRFSNQGLSPLHLAVQGSLGDKSRQAILDDLSDSPEIAQMLLEKGANPDNIFEQGAGTPLMKACSTNGYRSVPLLIKYGANIDICKRSGMTALAECFNYGTLECLK